MPVSPPNAAGLAFNLDLGALIPTANTAAATTTQTSADFQNPVAAGVKVVIDLTVNAGGLGSITATIQGKDPLSGKYYTVLASAALTGVATTVLTVYPGIAVSANVSASDVLPRTWRVLVTANNANPVTYTVGACLLD